MRTLLIGAPVSIRLIMAYRIENGQPLRVRHLSEYLVGHDEVIQETEPAQIKRCGELECVQGARSLRKAMPPNQSLSAGEMVGRYTDNLDVAGSHIHEETRTLMPASLRSKPASNLHGKNRLHFHEVELRDSNLLLQLRVNRHHLLAPDFWVVTLCNGA